MVRARRGMSGFAPVAATAAVALSLVAGIQDPDCTVQTETVWSETSDRLCKSRSTYPCILVQETRSSFEFLAKGRKFQRVLRSSGAV